MLKNISRFYFRRHFKLNTESQCSCFRAQKKDYLLYIHIPFCQELCPYCTFFRVPYEKNLVVAYYQALKKELFWLKSQGFCFSALYVGGGTPTVDMGELISLLQYLRELWPIREISLETHPNHLEKEKIEVLVKHGLKRLSVGVQSFDDQLLKAMNRYEKYGSSLEIQERIKNIAHLVPTLNIDLIFGLENQTLAMIHHDLETFKNLGANQISYYPLMGERHSSKALSLVKEKKFYQAIYNCMKQDFPARSPWCFSKNKDLLDEYIIDHEEYVGAGAGALSYLNGSLFAQSFSVNGYIKKMNQSLFLSRMKKPFTRADQIRYRFFSQLFGRSIEWKAMKKQYGPLVFFVLCKELLFFRCLLYFKKKKGFFVLKPEGFFSLMLIMKEFFHGVNIFRKMAIASCSPSCDRGKNAC